MLSKGADKCQFGMLVASTTSERWQSSGVKYRFRALNGQLTQRSVSGATSAGESKNLYSPVQSAFQTQGGGLSRLEREDLPETHRQNRGVGVGWGHAF